MDEMISRKAAIDLFPDDDLEYDTKGGYIAPHLARRMICELPFAQPDHIADIGKKVDMMHEYIYKIVKDCDGVHCYIKQGEIIRCKDCKFAHITNDRRYCKLCDMFTDDYGQLIEMYFDSNFYCGYAERRTDGQSKSD